MKLHEIKNFGKLNLDSKEKFDYKYGDISNLISFIEDCDSGYFIDDDGFVGEILLDEMVVLEGELSPKDFRKHKKELLELNERFNYTIEVVWYNR